MSRSDPSPELEALFEGILDAAEDRHEGLVEEACRSHPEHAAVLWQWLARTRRLSNAAVRRAVGGDLLAIGPYTVVEKLGQGGMGTVYRARHHEIGREVALKVIRPDLLVSPRAVARFRREMQALSRVQHRHVCPVLEIGEDDGVPWMAMPLLAGEDLASRIHGARREGRTCTPIGTTPAPRHAFGPPPETASLLLFFEQAALGLQEAHRHGLVHRDIKAANLFVTAGGEPVILDFGLARDATDAARLSGSREQIGTPEYMAPEQVEPGVGAVDARTDVYSLGVTLYEALALASPFTASSRIELFRRIRHTDAPPLDQRCRHVPRDVATVVAKAMRKSPAARYQTAAEMADDLQRARLSRPILARRQGPLLRLLRWVARNPIATLLIVATATAAIVTGVMLSVRQRALAHYGLLATDVMLRRVQAAEQQLYPAWPSRIPDLEAWLAGEADTLRHQQPRLLETLAGLRARGTALPRQDPEGVRLLQALDADEHTIGRLFELLPNPVVERWMPREKLQEARDGIAQRRPKVAARAAQAAWVFASTTDQFVHDQLASIVADVEAFIRPETGTYAKVQARLATARTLAARDQADGADLWRRTLAAIQADERFRGLRIAPQEGLLPLGADPGSGLQEFAVLTTGEAPVRGPDGALTMTTASAMVLVIVPGGSYRQGDVDADLGATSPYEQPVTEITLESFFLGKHEISQAQWERLTGSNPSYWRPGLMHPVERVSWQEVTDALAPHGLVLPTEAQWEYSCKAGTRTAWYTGNEPHLLVGHANLADRSALAAGKPWGQLSQWRRYDDGYQVHAPIDSLQGNPWGFHHMIGNVAEICMDAMVSYAVSARPGDGLRVWHLSPGRVIRGGHYMVDHLLARSTSRGEMLVSSAHTMTGARAARLVRPVDPPTPR